MTDDLEIPSPDGSTKASLRALLESAEHAANHHAKETPAR
jgi:hypothetical protein